MALINYQYNNKQVYTMTYKYIRSYIIYLLQLIYIKFRDNIHLMYIVIIYTLLYIIINPKKYTYIIGIPLFWRMYILEGKIFRGLILLKFQKSPPTQMVKNYQNTN